MGDVAIVGAGGFVGARVVEMATLSDRRDVRPVVRAFRSVARIANLGVRPRLGDASRTAAIQPALEGCDAVVNVTTGDPAEILSTTRAVYDAAVAVGARTFVHLSSATVFGGIERPDLPEDAPPRLDHWMPYAREKARAELFLRERMREGGIATVVLRPGLVWGPGSPWVLGPAQELVRGIAYLVEDGAGVCNLMYVDDLARAILRATQGTPSGFYNVGDGETVTWREYYEALAAGLGVDPRTIHRVPGDRYRAGLRERVGALRDGPAYRWLKGRLSPDSRAAIKLRLARTSALVPAGAGGGRPSVTRTMWDLQRTRHALPTARFRAAAPLEPRTPFDDGMRASLEWLRFLGVDPRPAPPPRRSIAAEARSGQEREMGAVDLPVG